jgi:exoribonuclease R
MQTARYVCTHDREIIPNFDHYSLNVPLYTHFTSPIRRYPDILVHRLLEASLTHEDPNLLESSAIWSQVAEYANQKKMYAKRAEDQCRQFYLFLYLKKIGPIIKTALVTGISRTIYSLIIPDYGLETTIRIDGHSTFKKKGDEKSSNSSSYCCNLTSDGQQQQDTLTIYKMPQASSDPKMYVILRVFQKVRVRLSIRKGKSPPDIRVALDASEYRALITAEPLSSSSSSSSSS